MSITVLLIIVTVGISFLAFNKEELMDRLIFYPPAIAERNGWVRLFSCGFIHGDIPHLLFNMYSLYLFGEAVELRFGLLFGEKGKLLYLVMYITAIAVAILPTYFKNKHNYHYKSLGASGAVSAVVGAYLALFPRARLGLVLPLGLFLEFVKIPASLLIGVWIVVQLLFTWFGPAFGAVVWWTHIAGFAVGAVFAFLSRPAIARRLRN